MSLFSFITRLPPRFTLFPYTTLFRSSLPFRSGTFNETTAPPYVVMAAATPFWLPSVYRSTCWPSGVFPQRSEEHTSELQSHSDLVCRLLLEKKKNKIIRLHSKC